MQPESSKYWLNVVQSNPSLKRALTPRMTRYIPHEPTPKQAAFLWLMSLEAFYGGAAGGGKSDALLMAALQFVDVPGYSALLVRDTYKNLSMEGSLITRSFEWLLGTDAKWIDKDKKWLFPSGATLSFGYLDSPRDHFNYQSSEFQFIGLDEIVNIRENQALYLFSRLRMKTPEAFRADLLTLPKFAKLTDDQIKQYYEMYSGIPLRFRAASNPPTREQVARGTWVKSRYVDPKTRKDDVVFIPAWLDDNPHVDKVGYRLSLSKLDEITRRQLEEGNWELQIKGAVFDPERFSYFDFQPSMLKRYSRILCVIDPAKGKNARGDFPAIVWLGLDADSQVIDIFDNIDERMPLDDTLKEAARRNFVYGTTDLIYEGNSAFLLDRIIRDIHDEVARDLGILNRISIQEIIHTRGSGSKDARVISMQPYLYGGLLRLRSDWRDHYPELFNQLQFFKAWDHDDFPDAIEFGIYMLKEWGYNFMAIGANGLIDKDTQKIIKSMGVALTPQDSTSFQQGLEWGLLLDTGMFEKG